MKYRLFESAAYLGVPAFADSDDFDALRLWAVEHNDWKGIRTVAVIVSDDERSWKINRDGSAKQRTGSHWRSFASGEVREETARPRYR